MSVPVALSGHGHDRCGEARKRDGCAPNHWAACFGLALAVALAVVAGCACSLSLIIPRASYSARCASIVGLAVSGRTA